ncbi:hypothetical protein BWQ96_09803 [Gracilariopsis chorda]|uniref:NB-ARC domain-containing protein n=1 Tax=Gracilariopsis chorda TaxID=448386 RepID=A0A2V3IH61_9FLOR|nr:hypothetical protein BWQ96_09803 [Gracilariopsis chorda]|eukprot:PXF40480.1 hypothetical protein BWQ96_09803 [Gracilariopsis chorda]
MAESWTVDRLLNLSRRLSRRVQPLRQVDPHAAELHASLTRLTHSLQQIIRNYPPPGSLLWIDDVGAALHSAYRFLHTDNISRTTILSHKSKRSSIATTNNSRTNPISPSQPRRRMRSSVANLFSSNSSRSAINLHLNTPSDTSASRATPKSIHLFKHSFSRLLFSSAPKTNPSTSNPLKIAAQLADEWIIAVRSASESASPDDVDSWLSLSDALPPMPDQHAICQHPVYSRLRQLVSDAASNAHQPPQHNDRPVPSTIAMVGPHGVGKSALAIHLVHDLATTFAEGATWIQLGANLAEEELLDQLVRCIDSLIAGDFRASVRYCSSLAEVLERATRLLSHVSTLLVVDDVVGPAARQALEAIISAMGSSSVVLYTSPNDLHCDQPNVITSSCVATVRVNALSPRDRENHLMFRAWLPKSVSTSSCSPDFIHADHQQVLIQACHGLPRALAMSAGFISRFPNDWALLAATLASSTSGDETVFRILKMLQAKGKQRFENQLRDIACLPEGVWISLSALADLWGVDYRSIKESARRMGRIAFADYRLGDTSDDSRVRFHSHVYRYCQKLATDDDFLYAHRKMLANMQDRRSQTLRSRLKTHYVSWWTACLADSYTCRRLHWHISRARQSDRLRELICDYDWLCQRLEQQSTIGVLSEFAAALHEEEQRGDTSEVEGVDAILQVIQEAGRLRSSESLDPSAFPTLLVSRLCEFERSSLYVKELIASTCEKARRPWLKPIPPSEVPHSSTVTDSVTVDSDSDSEVSDESEEPVPLCSHSLASSSSGKVVCGDRNGNIQVYDPVTGKNIIHWCASILSGTPYECGLSALGTVQDFVISGHQNGHLYMRSIRTGQIELIQESTRNAFRISTLATTDDGVVAVGDETGGIYVLKHVDEFGCKPMRIELDGHCDSICCLHVFPDGQRVASCSYNGFANIWNIERLGRSDGRVSLNGHRPSIGHKENYITTFATIGGGKRLLSACRAGVVNAWNAETGACVWTHHYGYQFSRSLSLQAFGIRHFASGRREGVKAMRLLNIGYPYMITRGDDARDLVIVTAGNSREVLATVSGEQFITNWLEMWHPGSQRIFVAVSYGDGRLSSYELVTALK